MAGAPPCESRGLSGNRVETYYVYHLHPNGRFAARDVVRAEDDDGAATEAARLYHGYAMELWQGPRMVRTFALPARD